MSASSVDQLTLELGTPSPAWGILEKDLYRLDHDVLKVLYDGIKNVTIPYEMLRELWPHEIIAKYYGAAQLKREHVHTSDRLPYNFDELIHAIDNSAFGLIGQELHGLRSGRRIPAHDQVRRLTRVSESARREFVTSMHEQYESAQDDQSGMFFRGDITDHQEMTHFYVAQIYDCLEKTENRELWRPHI